MKVFKTEITFLPGNNYPDVHHLQGLMKFATQISPLLNLFQEKEEVYNRIINLELGNEKRSAQIRELTRLMLTIRDEVNHKHSGFFSSKKKEDPLPPELEHLVQKVVTSQ